MDRIKSLIVHALGASLLLLSHLTQAAELQDNLALERFMDGVVEPLMKNNNSPSGVVVIAHKGEVIFSKGYGYEDLAEREPVDPDSTLFRPGSVSKLFTWVAVMQQVERGNLDLDTDVNEYLESVEIKDTFDAPVTLRHILTHTAGFEDGALGYLIIDDPERAVPLKESMSRFQPERVNPPGAQTSYSNYATALAGLIVANVSGKSFEQYIQDEIFTPLGMDNATFEEPLPPRLQEQMAESYAFEAGGFVPKPFEIISSFGPAGGMSASGRDMARFAQAILNGGTLDRARILGRDTMEEMLTRQFTHDDRLMGMGLGFYESDVEGNRVLGHGGDTIYFHSYLGVDAKNDLAFFASFAADGGRVVRSSVFPALYREYFPRTESPPAPPADFAERAGRYAGSYGFWRKSFSKIEKALGLTGVVTVSPGPENTLVLSLGGKSKQYAEVDEHLFHEMNSGVSLLPGISPRQLAFQEDADGNVYGFVMDGLPFMSLRRLPAWETPNFNFLLLGLALFVFLMVILRRFFARREIATWREADRSAYRAAFWASLANWVVIIAGVITITLVQDRIFGEIPLLFKTWLVLPIVAVIAIAWLLLKTAVVWKDGLLAGVGARLRYTVVALSGLFMVWFYTFWNILGFQYLA